jgi:hypothetical protein
MSSEPMKFRDEGNPYSAVFSARCFDYRELTRDGIAGARMSRDAVM